MQLMQCWSFHMHKNGQLYTAVLIIGSVPYSRLITSAVRDHIIFCCLLFMVRVVKMWLGLVVRVHQTELKIFHYLMLALNVSLMFEWMCSFCCIIWLCNSCNTFVQGLVSKLNINNQYFSGNVKYGKHCCICATQYNCPLPFLHWINKGVALDGQNNMPPIL